MTRTRGLAALVAASVALGGCGGAGGDKPLSPSSGSPPAQKQSRLTRGEYPAMREWILDEGSSAASQRQICERLDAAPDTPVIRATRNACERTLSVLIDIEDLPSHTRSDVESECPDGGHECRAGLLRPYGTQFEKIKRVYTTYYRDVAAVMKAGPCRAALAPPGELAKLDRYIAEFERAVDEFAEGNEEPLDEFFADEDDDDIDDPTPCRPA